MKLGVFGKPVRAMKSVLTRKSKKEEVVNSLLGGDTSIPKKFVFKTPTFAAVGKTLQSKASGFFGGVSLNISRNSLVKVGDTIRAVMLCATVALNAVLHTLPKTFAGNEGIDFSLLISKTTTNKMTVQTKMQKSLPPSNKPTSRVTAFEVIDYIKRNKHIPGHITQKFSGYTEKEIKQLSEEWFDLTVTPMSLAKCVSGCASFNSPEHMAYLAKIGFDLNNIGNWMPKVFEDRIRAEIHSYQVFNDHTLRITYEIPIPLSRSAAAKNKYETLGSDPTNFFKNGLVSMTIVIEYTFNQTTKQYNKKSGKRITAYLHNLPYKSDDIKTLLTGGRDKYYFGGDRGTTRKYINSTGTLGMTELPGPGPISFRLLNTSVTKKAKGVEANNPSGFIVTHLFVPPSSWQTQTKNKTDVSFVEWDSGNIAQINTLYGPYANTVNQNYSQRLAIQRQNGLI